MSKYISLSIVIPAYNEEDYLPACLNSIAQQTQPPDEVLVIDNNSTDNTAKIAKAYPFVRLVNEKKQGVFYANMTGFEQAKMDIIGRIDADSVLAPDWCAKVREQLAVDNEVAVTGPGVMAVAPFVKKENIFWTNLYHNGILGWFRYRVFSGANMAIKASVWNEVKSYVPSKNSGVHEDQLLAAILNMNGYRVVFCKDLLAKFDAERFWDMRKLLRYYEMNQETVRRAKQIGQKIGKAPRYDISLTTSLMIRALALPMGLAFLVLATMFFGARMWQMGRDQFEKSLSRYI